jgi:hypothetical protein
MLLNTDDDKIKLFKEKLIEDAKNKFDINKDLIKSANKNRKNVYKSQIINDLHVSYNITNNKKLDENGIKQKTF